MKIDAGQIPDLSRLEVQSHPLAVRHSMGPMLGFVKPEPWRSDTQLWALVMNFVRLADIAGVEYEAGRTVLVRLWDDVRQEQPFVWLTLRAGGHFETCITAAHRAVRHLAGLKGYPTVPPNLSARLPATAPLLSGNGEQQIKDMRDAIQHQEERILGTTKKNPNRPSFQQGDAWGLYPTGDEPQEGVQMPVKVIDWVELGSHRIRLHDLAQWVTELNGYARTLTEAW